MIAWFGPAFLLVLLAAAQLPEGSGGHGGTVAAVHGEEHAVTATISDARLP